MAENNKVTVVIPSIGRPEQLKNCLAQLLRTAPDIEIIAVIPPSDLASRKVVEDFVTIEIVDQDEDGMAIGAWNKGAAHATGDFLVTGADDVWFEQGWLEEALEGMLFLRGYGMVGLNCLDGYETNLSTHFMVSRAYAVNEWGGVLFFPQYAHFYPDIEANERAKRDECFLWAKNAIVEHKHWVFDKAPKDDIYSLTDGLKESDKIIYEDRKERGFPNDHEPAFGMLRNPPTEGWGRIAIGQRMYGYPDPHFHHAFVRMAVSGLRSKDQIFEPVIGKPAHLAANHIVRKFLNTTCDSLLFVDDDMIFEPDALERLRSDEELWNYDIVYPFATHREWPPSAVVMRLQEQVGLPVSLLGERYGTLRHIEDEAIIDVDAVGLAFTLIRRQVFESMLSEFGALYTSWFNWGELTEGEDIRFSRKARDNGFSLAVTTKIKLGHVGRHVFTWDDHQRWLEQEKNENG